MTVTATRTAIARWPSGTLMALAIRPHTRKGDLS